VAYIGAAVALGVVTNVLREEPLPLTGRVGPPPAPEAGAGLPASSVDDAYASWLEGAFFLDVRPRDEWETRRVAGSWSLDADAFDDRYFEIGGILEPSLPLFLYGAGPDSYAVRRTAARLEEFGHVDVRFVVDGLDGLLAAGIDEAEGPEENAP
jgi:hypothetical protein